MKRVEIYKLQNDGSQNVVLTCRLNAEGVVVCEGSAMIIKNLQREGIRDYTNPGKSKLFFTDGLRFLKQLKFNFSSAYLSASDIIED